MFDATDTPPYPASERQPSTLHESLPPSYTTMLQSEQPEPLVWSIDRYQEAILSGVFAPSDRVELIKGALYHKADDGPRPVPFMWNVDRYQHAIAAGVLGELDRVELINGVILCKMAIGKRHADTVDKVNEYFMYTIGRKYLYRVQNPIVLPTLQFPEPDYAVIDRGSYALHDGQPVASDIKLLVEVAETSVEYDRFTKAQLYAKVGVPEYWMINLRDQLLELHVEPNEAAGAYANIKRATAGQTVDSPLCGPVEFGMFGV